MRAVRWCAEVAGAILPQWLSGHAFLFPAARDLERARSMAAGAAPVVLSYEAGDILARAIAERIAVNAKDGVVTLSGTVPSYVDRRAAEGAAWSAVGVRDVRVEIVVVL